MDGEGRPSTCNHHRANSDEIDFFSVFWIYLRVPLYMRSRGSESKRQTPPASVDPAAEDLAEGRD